MSFYHSQDKFSGSQQVHFLNVYTTSAGVAPTSMDVYLRRGRQLQALAVRNGIAAAFSAIYGLARRAVVHLQRLHNERRTERELRALSPRILRDIGIEGHQIPAIARGLHEVVGAERVVAKPDIAPATGQQLDKAA